MSGLKLHIPNIITEFDGNMLVPLNKNFYEIQRHVAASQIRIDTLETNLLALTQVVTDLIESLST